MKTWITFLAFFLSLSLVMAQSIEIDHTDPSLKIFDDDDEIGISLGYFVPQPYLDGYHLSIKESSANMERIHLYGGGQGELPFMHFKNYLGNTSVRIVAEGYGPSQDLGRVITDQLEIKAGSDLAEYFVVESDKDIKPGLLASISTNSPGELILSEERYDRKIVGVVSGANGLSTGMYMGQQGSIAYGSQPVALTGRAYVYASTENGEIQPGDFLTSSSIPGYAMKVKKMRKARGAIVGKALSGVDDNGFVLVLVNLQ